MPTLTQVRIALKDAIDVSPDLNVYDWVPDSIIAPAAFIQPASPLIEYQTRFGAGKAIWRFHITVLLSNKEEQSNQMELDEYLSPTGPIVTALQGPDSSLGGVIDFANVVRAERYGSFRVGDTNYFGAQLLVEVTA